MKHANAYREDDSYYDQLDTTEDNPDLHELSYAVIDMRDETIVWKPFGFTPKRKNAVQRAIELGIINVNYLETIV